MTPKQRASLKPGNHGQIRTGQPRKDKGIQTRAKRLLEDPAGNRRLIEQFRKGTLPPPTYALLSYYAYGKPKETIDIPASPATVTIIHKLRESTE